MFKLLYKPVAIVAGIVGGVLSGLIFKNLWKVAGRGSDPPAPLDSERGWGRSCSPRSCMARYTRWSRRLSIVAPPSGRARQPGSGRTGRSIIPAGRPAITKLKPPPVRPGNRHGQEPAAAVRTAMRPRGTCALADRPGRSQPGDDGRAGAPGCWPRAVDGTLTRGLRYVTGGRGTAVIRDMREMIRSVAADALPARVTRYG